MAVHLFFQTLVLSFSSPENYALFFSNGDVLKRFLLKEKLQPVTNQMLYSFKTRCKRWFGMTKILIVEDELTISQVLKAYFTKLSFHVTQCFRGDEALAAFEQIKPDLVLLDVMLPGKSGWAILKEIRQLGNCPVIMLTALGDVNNRLEGFSEGADDYIPKPFNTEEVVARARAVLRRAQANDASDKQHYGQLEVNFQSHRIYLASEEILLTPRDLSVILFLAEHPNRTFTREQLIDKIWGWEYSGSDRAVDLSIKRIRKALGEWPIREGEIRTLRGLGYQLRVETNN